MDMLSPNVKAWVVVIGMEPSVGKERASVWMSMMHSWSCLLLASVPLRRMKRPMRTNMMR